MPKHLTVNDAEEFLAATMLNEPGGVAGLDANGKVPVSQIPGVDAAVSSVNGKTGDVTLTYHDIQAVGQEETGVAGGVATLDSAGHVPVSQLPSVAVQSVNGQTGPSVVLGASDVSAVPTAGGNVSGPLSVQTTGQSLFAKSTSTTTHALTAYMAATSGTTNSAINAVSDNPGMSTVQVTGTETNRGTVKIAHHGYADGSDSSAAAISIDLQTTQGGTNGTAAQGVFITSTTGNTVGNLITARNNGRDDFVVKNTGQVGIRVATNHTPSGALEVAQGDDATVGIAMTANSSSAQQMMLLKDATGASRLEVNAAGNTVHRATAFFTGALQLGGTSTDLGGSSGSVISMKNATTVPSTNPTGGAILYADSGVLKVRQADGTIVTLANAGSGGGSVTSVNGHTGVVVLAASDVSAVATSQINAANGVAGLDSSSKLTGSQQLYSASTTIVGVGAANSAGTANSAARGDHVHAAATIVNLTYGTTVSTNAALGNRFRLTMTGNATLAAPTNPTDGQMCIWEVTASGGARTLTLATGAAGAFAFGTDITALTATASGLTDYIGATYNATAARWRVIAYVRGY